jgi:hypothetical protein
MNIDIDSALSASMRKLIMSAVRVGQENPNIDPLSLCHVTSRPIITCEFISESQILYDDHFGHYRAKKYITSAVDVVEPGQTNYLDILITNALIDAHSIVRMMIRHFSGDSSSYKEMISCSFMELETDCFVIAGIVTYSLRVQVSIIGGVQSPKPNRFVHILCECHCFTLTIKDLTMENETINRAIWCFEAFSKLLKASQNKITNCSYEMIMHHTVLHMIDKHI